MNSRICVWWSQIFNGDKIRKCRSEKQIGDLRLRTNFEFDHRLHAAWAKVHTFTFFQQTHSHICEIEIETLGFRGVLSATSGFSILPLTRVQIHELDVVQRRVLRSIFGWVQIGDEARGNNSRLPPLRLRPMRQGTHGVASQHYSVSFCRGFAIIFFWTGRPSDTICHATFSR